ncbi:DUF5719 family protein [Nocardiopsis xinjiangensis]|uniref:DUF5719 family protein n=1 Tax=Nocardiopsis xinjiangensis TaxID=124285 RepID=UPI000349BDB4|nr:DUF5719 family protein [Nocardiopsis xinjiangensis]
MRLIVENRFALFGLVVLSLAALLGAALLTRPLTAEVGVSEAGAVRPDRAVRVCPQPHEDSDADSAAAAFAPRVSRDDEGELWAVPVSGTPDGEDGADADEDTRATPGPGADHLDEDDLIGEQITEPGLVWSTGTDEADDPTAVHAAGDLASGLEVSQVTSSDDEATEVVCAQPSIGTWFALPGGDDPDGVDLDGLTAHLANPEDFRATVNVDIYTADGPSHSPESRGIPLGPGESTELDLTESVHSTSAAGVHVRTSTGRVAASLLAEHSSGGTDWVNPTTGPAENAVVPGVPGGEGVRRLLLAAPGDEPVTAQVHVLTSERAEEDGENGGDGAGTPGDPYTVTVPPAASAWLSLESALAEEPGTAVIEADGEVVAGAVAETDGGSETAYSAAADPLSRPLDTMAVLPDVPREAETEVVVGATERDTEIMATPVGDEGDQGDAVKLRIPAGTTQVLGTDTEDVAWEPPPGIGSGDGYAVRLDLVDEDSGPVHVARVLRTDDGIGAAPVRPAPVEVPLPVVRDSSVALTP